LKNWWHNNKCTICYCCYLYNLWLLNAKWVHVVKGHVIAQSYSHYFYITQRNINSHHSQSFLLSAYNSLLNRDWVQEWHHNTTFCSTIWCYTNCTPTWFGLLFMLHECWALCILECCAVTWVTGAQHFETVYWFQNFGQNLKMRP